MPNHEELTKQLEAAREPKWLDKRLNKLARWPGKKRSIIRSLLEPPRSYFDQRVFRRRIADTKAYFSELTTSQRRALWEGLFPKLANHLERAWLDAANTPYERGYDRRAFRAPHRADTVAECRAAFFCAICSALAGLNPDAEWLAAWAPHLGYAADTRAVGWLLAAALRSGGKDADAVRAVLSDSINGEHEIGQMGRHCIVAFLNSDDRSDWEMIGKLLVAARRQEGLRQAILECVDEANPEAFRYMFSVILEHDLARFSATVRAFDVWLGMEWAAGSTRVVEDGIRKIAAYLDDDTECMRAISEGAPEDAYLALWATAYVDAEQALERVKPLLEAPSPERRFVALWSSYQIGLFPTSLSHIVTGLMNGSETDPRLLMATASMLARLEFTEVSDKLFQSVANLFEQMPAKTKKLDPIVWPWAQYALDRRVVAAALKALAMGAPDKLIPFAQALDGWDCVHLVEKLAGLGEEWVDGEHRPRKRRKLTPEARGLMLSLVGDKRQDVQKAAFKALADQPVREDEVETLLDLLHRTAPALRAGAIGRLSKLPDKRALSVVRTLVADAHSKKRSAGLELAAHLIESGRSSNHVTAILREHREALTEPDQKEIVDRLLAGDAEAFSAEDCLGLVPPGSRSVLPAPSFEGIRLETDAARACLRGLAKLLLQHGETEIEVASGASKEQVILASAGWRFPGPQRERDVAEDAEERLPLCDVWVDWLENRPETIRDADGLEWVRAWAWCNRGSSYLAILPKPFRADRAWELTRTFTVLANWMLAFSRPQGGGRLLVQYFEDYLAKKVRSAEEKAELKHDTYFTGTAARRLAAVRNYSLRHAEDFGPECRQQLCLAWTTALERSVRDCQNGPDLEHFVAAYDAQLLNEYDFIWLLLSPRAERSPWSSGVSYGPIGQVTGLREAKELSGRPRLQEAVRNVRQRIVEVELTRGECLTPASVPASLLGHVAGADVLFKLVGALGRDKIIRQDQWGDPTRAYSFSRLISVTAPGADDTLDDFKRRFEVSGLKPARLVEVAMYAPQWAAFIEHALGMPGLEDAVWWIHAHTKQSTYWRAPVFRELWAARINERTELDAGDLEEGAVDVVWFGKVIDTIGLEAWERLQKPTKYASNSGGHKRAQLFADAMLSRVAVAELVSKIDEKRHQDSVRALGLVPLPTDAAESKAETLSRYKRLQEFKRQSRKFGSQRQASEGKAVAIGIQNLARTAGYRDPGRLQWAMEAEAVADLARGAVEVVVDDTTVSLAITAAGGPELTVVKKDRTLKSIPAKLKKNADVAALRSRVTELRRQRSRMRLSLEESMCRGDTFSREDLEAFYAHPMLRPMVERLVFVGNDDLVGYPDENGRVLRDHRGTVEPIGHKDILRIAHSVDLLHRGDWSKWQRECFSAERVQPFKQVFRETYPKTATELDACDFTRRYAGHQVNPRQALALLKQRQWVAAPEEGVRKTFHDEGLTAELWFQEVFYTPADVEDLTLEGAAFVRRRSEKYERVPIDQVPDRVFSEAMRDLDLVVSVAHSGGIDPEASASTVEMRASLLRETCQLLGLSNVRVDGHHAKIDGTLASYSVHLGSATTTVLPGRVLIIVAVHSQYRGRLFLPFADDDPKTAEVLSKTLLLARDSEIKDPSILDQIRH